jgi:hypothetical protein
VQEDLILQGSARGEVRYLPARAMMRRVMSMSQASRPVREIEQPNHASGEDGGWINRKATELATRAANARQLSGRRRFVDRMALA